MWFSTLIVQFIICSYTYHFRLGHKCHLNLLSVLVKKFPDWYENQSRWQGLASLVWHHDMAVLIISFLEHCFWYVTKGAAPLHWKLQAWVKAAFYIILQGELGEESAVLLLTTSPSPKSQDLLALYFKFVFKTVHCSSILVAIIQNNVVVYKKAIVCVHINIFIVFLGGKSRLYKDSKRPPQSRLWIEWKSCVYRLLGFRPVRVTELTSFPILLSAPTLWRAP